MDFPPAVARSGRIYDVLPPRPTAAPAGSTATPSQDRPRPPQDRPFVQARERGGEPGAEPGAEAEAGGRRNWGGAEPSWAPEKRQGKWLGLMPGARAGIEEPSRAGRGPGGRHPTAPAKPASSAKRASTSEKSDKRTNVSRETSGFFAANPVPTTSTPPPLRKSRTPIPRAMPRQQYAKSPAGLYITY